MKETLEKVAHDDFDFQAFLGRGGEGKTVSTFHKNETVFAQGGLANSIFYIQKGSVKLVVLSEQGKEAVVGVLEPGKFFDAGCLNGQPLQISTAKLGYASLHG